MKKAGQRDLRVACQKYTISPRMTTAKEGKYSQ